MFISHSVYVIILHIQGGNCCPQSVYTKTSLCCLSWPLLTSYASSSMSQPTKTFRTHYPIGLASHERGRDQEQGLELPILHMGELSLRVAKPYLTSFQSLPGSTIRGPSAWSLVVISSTRKPQTVILPEASITKTPTLPRGPTLPCYSMPFSLLSQQPQVPGLSLQTMLAFQT